MASSTELLRRYTETGDEEAFGFVVRGHIDLVYSIALRQACGEKGIAEEATSAVFSLLARKSPSLLALPSLNSWLYRATIFEANALIRRDRRRREREQRAHLEAAIMNADQSSDSTEAEWTELRPLLDRAVGRLKDRERDAVLLRFFENRSYADVGLTLGISPDAARRRVERALKRLRRHLGASAGRVSSATAVAGLLAESGATAAPASLVAQACAWGSAPAAGFVSALGTVTFMNSTKTIIGAAALLILAAGASWYEMAQMRYLPKEVAIAQRKLQILRASAAGADGVLGRSLIAGPPKSARAAAQWNSRYQRLAADPGYQRTYVRNVLAQFQLRFGPVAAAVGIPADRVARAMQEYEKYLWDSLDGKMAAMELGLSPNDGAVRWMDFQRSLDLFGSVESLVGTEIFALVRPGGPAQELVAIAPFASALYDSDAPLTMPQAYRLSQLLAAHHSELLSDEGMAAIMEGAAQVLSPSQLPAFQRYAVELQFQTAIARQGGEINVNQL